MIFREKKQMSLCILALMLVVDFFLFGHRPLYRELKEIKHAKTKHTFFNAKASAEGKQLSGLGEQLLKLREEVGNYEANVPRDKSLGTFLHKIANLMNEHNLHDQLIQPSKEIEVDKLNCIPITMQCKGGLEDIFDFYKSFQGLDRLVRIEQIRLINSDDLSGMVSMRVTAGIYYREDGSNKGYSKKI